MFAKINIKNLQKQVHSVSRLPRIYIDSPPLLTQSRRKCKKITQPLTLKIFDPVFSSISLKNIFYWNTLECHEMARNALKNKKKITKPLITSNLQQQENKKIHRMWNWSTLPEKLLRKIWMELRQNKKGLSLVGVYILQRSWIKHSWWFSSFFFLFCLFVRWFFCISCHIMTF